MADSTLELLGRGDLFGIDAALDPLRGSGLGGRGRRSQPDFPALPPEEAEPLKEKLLGRTLSGLGWLGSTLDKTFGARALRGVAAGKPGEALSAIPFSDTLGITDPKNAVSMDDLLTKHWGVLAPNDPTRWEARDFLVPALEIAADPGSYLNPFGALTKAGKLASGLGHAAGMSRRALTEGFEHLEPALRAAGRTTEEIADMGRRGARIAPEALVAEAARRGIPLEAGTPLRASVGVGLPFRDPAFAFGTGPVSQGWAGKLDAAGRAIKAAPGIKELRALFDTRVMKSADPAIARAAEETGVPARESAENWVRGEEWSLHDRLNTLIDEKFKALPGMENEALRVVRGAVENATLDAEHRVPHYLDPAAYRQDLLRRHGTPLAPSAPGAPARTLATGVADPHAVANYLEANWTPLQEIAARIHDFGAHVLGREQNLGIDLSQLTDEYADYAFRRYIAAAPGGAGWGSKALAGRQGRMLPVGHGSMVRRKVPIANVPGGSGQIDEWAINPALSGPLRTGTPAQVQQTLAADMTRNALAAQGGTPLDLARRQSIAGKARELSRWLAGVPAEHAAEGIPFFNPDVVGDLATRGHRHAAVLGSGEALLKGAGEMARPTSSLAPTEAHVPLGDFVATRGQAKMATGLRDVPLSAAEEAAIRAAGFTDRAHAWSALESPAADPAFPATIANLPAALVPKIHGLSASESFGAGPRVYEHLMRRFPTLGPYADAIRGDAGLHAQLNEFALPTRDADALTQFITNWRTPTEMAPFLGFARGFNNLFKNSVYSMWLASHVRNATSALWNNALHGTGLGDYKAARDVIRGRSLAGAERFGLAPGMLPEEAARQLRRGAYADAKVFLPVNSFEEHVGAHGLADEVLHAGLRGERRLLPRTPGDRPETGWLGMLNRPGAWNPLAQAGVAGHASDAFWPLTWGRRAGTNVEDFVRMANYLGNLRHGMAGPEAGRLTRAIHFDYSALTDFEKNVMKQVAPFYTFARFNTPYQLRMLATQPNKVGPLLHATGQTDTHRPWTPEYLASNLALPWGQGDADGTQRYLTSLGLPIEEMMQRFKFRGYELPEALGSRSVALPSFSQTGLAFLGQLGPASGKPLVEQMTDTQFGTGRRLSDLHSRGLAGGFGVIPPEYAQPLTQFIRSTPLSRLSSAVDQAADERKGLDTKAFNLLSGFRFADVDLEKQAAIARRQELDRLLRSYSTIKMFPNFYLDPKFEGTLPEGARQRLRLYTNLKGEAKDWQQRQRVAEQLKALGGP